MIKKSLIFVIVLIIAVLAGGGFFYWWQDQSDVRELNKTLPKGIIVEKSLIGGEYKVVNKIDGYEFKIPKEWQGITEIGYIPERTEQGYSGTSLNIDGKEGIGRTIGIDYFKANDNSDLLAWAQGMFNVVGLVGNFTTERIGNFEIVKTQENIHFGGEYLYFFKKNKVVYSLTGPSEELIRYIITNGKW